MQIDKDSVLIQTYSIRLPLQTFVMSSLMLPLRKVLISRLPQG
ncbi:hypothetical protein N183_34985 [Sinorhizobium sp. Sb3]|nr:hypothetical protein N183_34985 [Sinorhizobium sp. Sb3]